MTDNRHNGIFADKAIVNADGEQIPGLYAVGEMSNREYFNQTYMGAASVSFSSTMGRLVGELAAK